MAVDRSSSVWLCLAVLASAIPSSIGQTLNCYTTTKPAYASCDDANCVQWTQKVQSDAQGNPLLFTTCMLWTIATNSFIYIDGYKPATLEVNGKDGTGTAYTCDQLIDVEGKPTDLAITLAVVSYPRGLDESDLTDFTCCNNNLCNVGLGVTFIGYLSAWTTVVNAAMITLLASMSLLFVSHL